MHFWLHTCGNVEKLLPRFIDLGIDVIHPIQAMAAGMQPENLKSKFEGKVAFCGGVDTQGLLPSGTPEEIAAQVTQRLDILSKGGGYVFNTIHNIVGDTRAENIWAAFKAVHDYNEKHSV